jgi:hypothetical protein
MTPARFALVHRALTKIAVECAWLDLGEEGVTGPEFDRERKLVMRGGHHGYLIVPKQGDPEDHRVWMKYVPARHQPDGQAYLGIIAHFYGFKLVTDTLKRQPANAPPEAEAIVYWF